MKTETRQTLKIILSLMLVATLAFIWINSAKSGEDSAELSGGALDKIADFFESFNISVDRGDDRWLRKLAHFAEFSLLGGELSALMLLYDRRSLQSACNCLFAALLAATVDETIQIFSMRGSSVLDVLLDFSGACTAVLIIFFYVITKDKKLALNNYP